MSSTGLREVKALRFPTVPEREVSLPGGVRLLVCGPDIFPVEIVHLHCGMFEAEE